MLIPRIIHIYLSVYFLSWKIYIKIGKRINYYVAVKYQAKVESVIEKSNFYICMFTSEKLET